MKTVATLTLAGLMLLSTVVVIAPATTADHCDPRDPACKHEQQGKAHCYWTRTGAPGTPATGGAATSAQIMSLTCPNHILVKLEYGYKDCRSPIPTDCLAPAGNVLVTDLGQTSDPYGPCGWKHDWAVYAPNANIYNVFFKATTWKDADCDGAADDWNHDVVLPDGTLGCYWQNYYGPKWNDNPQGMYYPYFAPPFGPTPDGLLTYCDFQIYETQWRQFN